MLTVKKRVLKNMTVLHFIVRCWNLVDLWRAGVRPLLWLKSNSYVRCLREHEMVEERTRKNHERLLVEKVEVPLGIIEVEH